MRQNSDGWLLGGFWVAFGWLLVGSRCERGAGLLGVIGFGEISHWQAPGRLAERENLGS